MFDAEHFFDGFKNNKEYSFSCIKTAYDNGARWIVLCDTNGGTLPHEVSEIVKEVTKYVPGKNLGIHAHNDTGNAVANSLAAVIWCSSSSRNNKWFRRKMWKCEFNVINSYVSFKKRIF